MLREEAIEGAAARPSVEPKHQRAALGILLGLHKPGRGGRAGSVQAEGPFQCSRLPGPLGGLQTLPQLAPRPLPALEGGPQTSSGGAWSRSHEGSRNTGGKPVAWPTRADTGSHPGPALPGPGAPRAGAAAAAAAKTATARLRPSAAGSGAACFRAPSLLGASACPPRGQAGGAEPRGVPGPAPPPTRRTAPGCGSPAASRAVLTSAPPRPCSPGGARQRKVMWSPSHVGAGVT